MQAIYVRKRRWRGRRERERNGERIERERQVAKYKRARI
jgi:hypothetical protein